MEVITVKLYVKSIEKAVGKENIVIEKPTVQIIGEFGPPIVRTYPTREVQSLTKYECVLPEDQQHMIEIVKEAVSRLGFQLEIIDVLQRDFSDKPLPREVTDLKGFPVLAIRSKTVLIRGFSREDVEQFLSQSLKSQQ
jgi:hypothetical protein